MKKYAITSGIFLGIMLIFLLNLGKWLDITEAPVKSDIIVCLGGGDWHRYSKAVALFSKRYAKKEVMLLTGADVTPEMKRRGIPDGRITDLKKHHSQIHYSYHPELSSTREEVRFIKKFMLEHHYQSALIVTDPPHSRRFSILDRFISLPGDDGLAFNYVSSGVKWWHEDRYYENETARRYAFTELLKIPYNVLKLCCEEKNTNAQ